MRAVAHFIFGIYWMLVFALCSLTAWVLVAVVPGVRLRRQIARIGASTIFVLTGMGIRRHNLDLLPVDSCVVVANHASYLDGIIMTAALPARFAFVIKSEMATVPLAGYFLRRIGSHFVDRNDQRRSALAARQILKSAHASVSLGFFPEGTFSKEPGLKAFRPGAFRIAARAGLPVVPTIIQGSRHILPDGAVLPRPGRLSVTLTPPVTGTGADQLSADARAAIAQVLPEPDLAQTN